MVDRATGDWLIWCEEHNQEEELARAEGGERVQRFDGGDDEDE